MEKHDTLLTFTELSLALGGFTAVALAIRSSKVAEERSRFLMRSLLLAIFGATIVPLTVVALLHFGTSTTVSWRFGSGFIALWSSSWFTWLGLTFWRGAIDMGETRGQQAYYSTVLLISFANVLVQGFNAFGLFSGSSFAVLFAGLVWLFIAGVLGFVEALAQRGAALYLYPKRSDDLRILQDGFPGEAVAA